MENGQRRSTQHPAGRMLRAKQPTSSQQQGHREMAEARLEAIQQVADERLVKILDLEKQLRAVTNNYRVMFGDEPSLDRMRRAAEVIEAAILWRDMSRKNLQMGGALSAEFLDAVTNLSEKIAANEEEESAAIAERQTEALPCDYWQFFVASKYEGDRLIARYDDLCDAAQWIEERGRWRHLYRVLGMHRDTRRLHVVYEAEQIDDAVAKAEENT